MSSAGYGPLTRRGLGEPGSRPSGGSTFRAAAMASPLLKTIDCLCMTLALRCAQRPEERGGGLVSRSDVDDRIASERGSSP